jgi:tRNA-Thr(GGU) m(6)t(6)A37 methyltransferase TsaA
MSQISLEPIGVVRNEIRDHKRSGWGEVTSEVVIDEELAESLEGLEEFSHIIVVFWMHKSPTGMKHPVKVHPRGRADLPLVGLLATRAPFRPNSLGVSVVKLAEIRQNVLTVVGLDAMDGTPVIDIKPFMPPLDNPTEVRMPDWVSKIRTKK